VRKLSVILIVILFLCANGRADEKDIKIIIPDGFPGIHPNDLETTHYEGRDSLIIEYSNPAKSQTCQQIAKTIHDQMGEVLTYAHGYYRVPTIPKRFKHYFDDQFDIPAFEEQMAVLKTIARQFFTAEGIRNSIINENNDVKNQKETLLPIIPVEHYIDSLTVEPFRWLDVDSDEAQERAYDEFRKSFPSIIIEEDGERWIKFINVYSGRKMRDDLMVPVDEILEHWSYGPPIIIFPLVLWSYNGLPLGTHAIIPLMYDDEVVHFLDFRPYFGARLSSCPSIKSLIFEENRKRHINKYPYINLEKAEELVVAQTGETVKKSIYCSFLSVVFPVPAIITDENNVYFVDPIIQEVW